MRRVRFKYVLRDSDYDAIMMKDTFLNEHVVDRPINFPVQASVLLGIGECGKSGYGHNQR